MGISIKYQNSWDDLREAGHYTGPAKRSAGAEAFSWLVFGLLILSGIVSFRYLPRSKEEAAPIHVVLAGCYVGFWVVLIVYRRLRFELLRNGIIKAGPPLAVEITAEGVAVATRGVIESLKWSAFERRAETPAGFVLVLPTRRFYFLPKRAFCDAAAIAVARTMIVGTASGDAPDLQRNSEGPVPALPLPAGHLPGRHLPDASELTAHEKRAIWGVAAMFALAMGGPVVGLLIDPTSQSRWMPVLLFVSMTLAGGCYLYGCAEIARARGFKAEHGLIVGIIFPFVGLIVIATRAKPMPGEQVDRSSVGGLLGAPMARAKDMRSAWLMGAEQNGGSDKS